MNLDRFSQPLTGEGVLSLSVIETINQENKRDLVWDFISEYENTFAELPDLELIENHFYKIDLDSDMIESLLKNW